MDKLHIINSIINHYGFKKDSDFAKFIGVTSQVLSNWKSRNTYDAELIYTKCVEINPEWLLTGKGSMLKESLKEEPPDIGNYKELAEARKETIDVLKYKITHLEYKITELENELSEKRLKTAIDSAIDSSVQSGAVESLNEPKLREKNR